MSQQRGKDILHEEMKLGHFADRFHKCEDRADGAMGENMEPRQDILIILIKM